MLCLALGFACGSWARPLVVTSIRPLTMIVEAVAGDLVEVRQLLPDAAEPHHYSLRISERITLDAADLVLWIGPELEVFMAGTVGNINPEKVLTATALTERRASPQTAPTDPHVWLNPNYALAIATEVGNWLAAHFPELRSELLSQQQHFRSELNAAQSKIRLQLHDAQRRKIIVDHDAFGHFFGYFNIPQAGALKDASGLTASAGTMANLFNTGKADCVVAEPQSRHERVAGVAKKLGARVTTIDPLGADIALSSTAYVQLLESIARSLAKCLAPQDE